MCETRENKEDETKNEAVCSDMSISQKKEEREVAEIEEVRRRQLVIKLCLNKR
jgi:hypothetical protein